MSDTMTYWHTKEDAAVLCDPHAVAELNSAFPVVIGLVEPFASVEDASQRFADVLGLPDYFIGEPTGTCVECERQAGQVEAEAS